MTSQATVSGNSKRDTPLLVLDGVHHAYGPTVALAGVRIEIGDGEIRGLIGENGSGKSTLVKLLSGVMTPTRGTVMWQGRTTKYRSPRSAQRAGIVTVFQETLIAGESSVRDNMFLGQDGLVRHGDPASVERERAARIAPDLGLPVEMLERPVVQLSLAQRQTLTILRALTRPWKLLILDEATSALDLEVRDRLFALLKELTSRGTGSVLFVSHRMDELQKFVDRATVLASGRVVGSLEQADASPDALLRLMSQRPSIVTKAPLTRSEPGASADTGTARASTKPPEAAGTRPARLECQMGLAPGRAPVSIDVYAGEILGVAGLEGHGGAAFLECLVGIRSLASGEVRLPGTGSGLVIKGYRQAVNHGIAYVPGSRQAEGLFSPLSVIDNMMIATMSRHSTAGWFSLSKLRRKTNSIVDRLRIEVANVHRPVSLLSGGNQQKVLVGRWVAAEPAVLVMNDPLRGVDLGTKRQFYGLLRELAADGVAVVMLSTEIEELVEVCDRTAVFREKTLQAMLPRQEMGYNQILKAMFGDVAGNENAEGRSR